MIARQVIGVWAATLNGAIDGDEAGAIPESIFKGSGRQSGQTCAFAIHCLDVFISEILETLVFDDNGPRKRLGC